MNVNNSTTKGNYADINGLSMYYEIHGTGQPLVLLPGALSGIGSAFGRLIPLLARTRQVIAVELQGYGHTADIADRPLSYEHYAEDTAALLEHLRMTQTDMLGYSSGAGAALQVAIRYPHLVRKLVLCSVTYTSSGIYPEMRAGIEGLTPEILAGSPYEQEYLQSAPRPQDWPQLIAKAKAFNKQIQAWPASDLKEMRSPVLLIAGDSDLVSPEHIAEIFRLRGGGHPGDLMGLPASQMAILPGTTHMGLTSRTDLLMAMIPPFLDAPTPERKI
ncbi:MAG: alpha/beta hydrolase [Ktedonobacteraceae bacterium]|nr:alpha/beta hydrolase [Ktedonobacteraceae bacterium]